MSMQPAFMKCLRYRWAIIEPFGIRFLQYTQLNVKCFRFIWPCKADDGILFGQYLHRIHSSVSVSSSETKEFDLPQLMMIFGSQTCRKSHGESHMEVVFCWKLMLLLIKFFWNWFCYINALNHYFEFTPRIFLFMLFQVKPNIILLNKIFTSLTNQSQIKFEGQNVYKNEVSIFKKSWLKFLLYQAAWVNSKMTPHLMKM